METKKYNFKGTDVNVFVKEYANNYSKAILMNDAEDDLPFMCATVCIPDISLKENEIIIKNYSENKGVIDFLIKNNIVRKTNRILDDYDDVFVCKLLPINEWL